MRSQERAGSSNVEVQSIGFPGVTLSVYHGLATHKGDKGGAGLPPRTFKILAEHPLIVLFSVLGMSSLISSSDFITIFLSIELQSFTLYILATAWLTTMPKISLFLFIQEFALLYNWSTWTQLLLFSSMLSFIVGRIPQ